MKKFYALLVTVLLALTSAQAQVIVYQEDFNSTVSGVMLTNFVLNNDAPYADTLYTAGSYAQTSTTTEGPQTLVIDNNISTSNLIDITITWKEYRSQYHRQNKNVVLTEPGPGKSTTFIPNTNLVSLEYSLDGVNYTQVTGFTQNTTGFFTWNAINNGTPIKLPYAVYNQPNVRLRWKINVDVANTDFYAIDDVMIKGTSVTGTSIFSWATRPVGERPFEASSAMAADPYKVDGVTMRWTKTTIGAGAIIESEEVNTAIRKRKSFNLIQTGASSAAGTQVTLQLDKAVSGLTFTLYDVDRNAGQYLDKVEVTGYDGAKPVPLTRNSMLPAISNEFSNGAIRAKADGADSKVTSGKGDVTISFTNNIDKLVIRYFNDDAAKGRQGIAISDLSWARVDQSIAPMPVELATFKGKLHNRLPKLNWVTAMEKNNDRFIVERSQDGKTFTKVGEIKGNGNSSTAIKYTFADANPAAGTNYYRLKQIDYDGTVTYSFIVAVELPANFSDLSVKPLLYPTVASDVVNISLAGLKANVEVNVLDTTGKVVKQLNSAAGQELVLPVQELRKGAYFVSLTDGEHHETLRFIKR